MFQYSTGSARGKGLGKLPGAENDTETSKNDKEKNTLQKITQGVRKMTPLFQKRTQWVTIFLQKAFRLRREAEPAREDW